MAKKFKNSLKAGNIFGSEGIAMNMSVYHDELDTEFLPLNCNWILVIYFLNMTKQKTLVEPYLPNYKIGIMHLAQEYGKMIKIMRIDKDLNSKLKLRSIIDKKLRFSN